MTGSRTVPAQDRKVPRQASRKRGSRGWAVRLQLPQRHRSEPVFISRMQFPRYGGKGASRGSVRGRGEHGCTGMCEAIWHGPAAQGWCRPASFIVRSGSQKVPDPPEKDSHCLNPVRDSAVSTPPGLFRWIDDGWPATAAYLVMAAAGLVPAAPRLTA